jgi:hypothetical protein
MYQAHAKLRGLFIFLKTQNSSDFFSYRATIYI